LKDLIARHGLDIKALDRFGPEEVEARHRLLFDIASIIWKGRVAVLTEKAA